MTPRRSIKKLSGPDNSVTVPSHRLPGLTNPTQVENALVPGSVDGFIDVEQNSAQQGAV